MPAGRPTKYTKELGDEICRLVGEGSNFNRLAKDKNFPAGSTLFKWLREIPEFSSNYEKAIVERANLRYDSIDDEIAQLRAGTLEPAAAKIIIDTKKWQCSKEDQKRYGDRQEIEHSNNPEKPFVFGKEAEQSILLAADRIRKTEENND